MAVNRTASVSLARNERVASMRIGPRETRADGRFEEYFDVVVVRDLILS